MRDEGMPGADKMSLLWDTDKVAEARLLYVPDSPITFEQFLEMAGEDADLELVGGVLQERPGLHLDHELLFGWLQSVLGI